MNFSYLGKLVYKVMNLKKENLKLKEKNEEKGRKILSWVKVLHTCELRISDVFNKIGEFESNLHNKLCALTVELKELQLLMEIHDKYDNYTCTETFETNEITGNRINSIRGVSSRPLNKINEELNELQPKISANETEFIKELNGEIFHSESSDSILKRIKNAQIKHCSDYSDEFALKEKGKVSKFQHKQGLIKGKNMYLLYFFRKLKTRRTIFRKPRIKSL